MNLIAAVDNVDMRQQRHTPRRIGVFGAGYWGKNMLRVIGSHPDCELVRICDLDEQTAQWASETYFCDTSTNPNTIFDDSTLDAVYIATPPASHMQIATQALQAGKHVLIEKPLAENTRDASQLVALARTHGLTLMVGHTFLYSPPVMKVKELIDDGTTGDIFYIDSQRVNLGKYQDSGVLWDLAPHDLSIMLYWLNECPSSVAASGRSFRSSGREDVLFLTLEFPSGAIVQSHMSWLAPVKLRRTTLSGSNRMIVYDDTASHEPVKVFNHGVDRIESHNFGEHQLSYRQGDIWIPRLDNTEPLQTEFSHFLQCISERTTPRSSAEQGLITVVVMEACERALKSGRREHINLDMLEPRKRGRPRFGVDPSALAINKTHSA